MSISKEDMRRNIEAFKALEGELLEEHRGRYALLRDGELVGTYSDKGSARVDAVRRYPDGRCAISPAIGSPPVSLGAVGLYASPVGV